MKGDKSRRKNGFIAGHTAYYRKSKTTDEEKTVNYRYLRLSQDQHALVSKLGPGAEAGEINSKDVLGYRLLRPNVDEQSELEAASTSREER